MEMLCVWLFFDLIYLCTYNVFLLNNRWKYVPNNIISNEYGLIKICLIMTDWRSLTSSGHPLPGKKMKKKLESRKSKAEKEYFGAKQNN